MWPENDITDVSIPLSQVWNSLTDVGIAILSLKFPFQVSKNYMINH